MRRLAFTILLLFSFLPALAQDQPDAEQEKSYFLNFIEEQLSTPNRIINITEIEGVLSSNARIRRITIADRESVWLVIEDAEIVWSRSALLLGRLDIDRLAAETIEVRRRPLPDEGVQLEASGFSVPELPLEILLDEMKVDSVKFGAEVFGLESELAIAGKLQIIAGTFDAELDVTRLDGPGGSLDLQASYANETKVLDVDLDLSEPEDGVVANLFNFYGRPAVNLGLKGTGPVSDIELELELDADGTRVLTGQTRITGSDAGQRFEVTAFGPVGDLVEPRLRDLFGSRSDLELVGVVRENGGLTVDRFEVESGALLLSGSLQTATDGFPTKIVLEGAIGRLDGTPVVLPVPGTETTVRSAKLEFDFGGEGIASWRGDMQIDDFATAGFTAEVFNLNLSGAALALEDPLRREVTFVVDGQAIGLEAEDAGLDEAIGDKASVSVTGAWRADQPLTIDEARLESRLLTASMAGTVADLVFSGSFGLEVADAAVLAAATARDLSGKASFEAEGSFAPVSGRYDLELDGVLREFKTGISEIDGLLGGTASVTGHITRDESGIRARDLKVAGEAFTFSANGIFGLKASDIILEAQISELSRLTPSLSGRMEARATAKGQGGRIEVDSEISVPSGTVAGRRLSDARLKLSTILQKLVLSGTITGDAFLDGERVDLSANLNFAKDLRQLEDIVFNAGASRISGVISSARNGLFTGELNLVSADISTLGALFLRQAKGKVKAKIDLSHADGMQQAVVAADLENFVLDGISIGSGEANAKLTDLFGVPGADGGLMASDVVLGGVDISVLAAKATQREQTTEFEAGARLRNGASIATSGSLLRLASGYQLELSNADLVKDQVLVRLRQRATVLVGETGVSFEGIDLDVGGGRILVAGRGGEELDLSLAISDVPLDVVNAVRPDLRLGGIIDGNATITGKRTVPIVKFEITGTNVTASALADAGLPAVEISARGNTEGNQVRIEARVADPTGIDLTVSGTVPVSARGTMALDLSMRSFPLALVSAVAPGTNLGGILTGTANVTGTYSRPVADFDIEGTSITAAQLEEFGIGALSIGAQGRFASESIVLNSIRLSGAEGLQITGSGSVSTRTYQAELTLSGSAPLSLANDRIGEGGSRLSGVAEFSVRVSGDLRSPSITGSISTSGAAYVDPLYNVGLRDIVASASLDGDRLTIRAASANVAAGGAVNISGSVILDAGAGYPAELRLGLSNARYVDGSLVVATVSGDLAITGPLLRDPLVSGSIFVDRAELVIPEISAAAAAIDVIHVNPPSDVVRTLALARADDGTPIPDGRPSVTRLDVVINAPNRVFVRGRGLDAEMGGTVRIRGSVTDIQPVGGFDLIRGRLSLLGKRIVFDSGTVTLVGDLDPFINLSARSNADDVVVIITVTGRISDPAIVFTSQPNLPQDEVLSRLIFGRSISELSVLQIAKLAASAAALAGGGNESLLDSFRQSTGLDELDVITDSGGNAAVRAGRYIQDNIYLGVEASTSGQTRGTINLDITDNLTAKGAAGSDGESSIGIFFEKDY